MTMSSRAGLSLVACGASMERPYARQWLWQALLSRFHGHTSESGPDACHVLHAGLVSHIALVGECGACVRERSRCVSFVCMQGWPGGKQCALAHALESGDASAVATALDAAAAADAQALQGPRSGTPPRHASRKSGCLKTGMEGPGSSAADCAYRKEALSLCTALCGAFPSQPRTLTGWQPERTLYLYSSRLQGSS